MSRLHLVFRPAVLITCQLAASAMILAFVSVGSAQAAQILTVEWGGTATEYCELVDGAWVEVTGVSIPVSGTFGVDLDEIGGWPTGGGPESVTWLLEISDPALNQMYGFPGEGYWGSCDAWCALSHDAGDILGTLLFSGAHDPDDGHLDLGSGTFRTSGIHTSYHSISGTISSASYTIVPEPGTALLLAFGLIGVAAKGRRRSL